MGSGRVRGSRRGVLLFSLAAGVVVLAFASLFVGSHVLSPAEVWGALQRRQDVEHDVSLMVWELRVPRAFAGVLVGACLGVAGAVMQALTRNPLAEPGLLGINAGASAAVVTGIATAGSLGGMPTGPGGVTLTVLLAFAGAAAASVLVLAVGGAFKDGTDPVRLTLAGAALTVVFTAYTNAILLNRPTLFQEFTNWAVGSLQGRGFDVSAPLALLAVPVLVVACLCGRWLNALALGHDVGRSLGADPRRLGLLGGALVVVLAGTATAVAGPIAFVGLAAPLAVRAIVGPDYRWVLPLSALAAAVIVLGADIIGRLVMIPSEVETAVIASILGAPVFIALVRRRRWARL